MPIPDTSMAIAVPAYEAAGIAIAESTTLSPPNRAATAIRFEEATAPSSQGRLPPKEPAMNATPALPLASVHFRVQSAHPVDDPKVALSTVPLDGCYLVVGRADPTGPDRYIGPLSLERASYVAGVLRSAGFRAVKINGAGSAGTTSDRREWPKDRRADVFAASCLTPDDGRENSVDAPASRFGR